MSRIKIMIVCLLLAVFTGMASNTHAAESTFKMHMQFDEVALRSFENWFDSLGGDVDTIHIRIHSPGGDVFVLARMLTKLKQFNGKVVTHNDGMAASCGFVLFLFGDERIAYPLSVFLSHEVASGARGKTHDIEATAKLMKIIQITSRTRLMQLGVPEEIVNTRFDTHSDEWFGGDELLKLGVVTKIK